MRTNTHPTYHGDQKIGRRVYCTLTDGRPNEWQYDNWLNQPVILSKEISQKLQGELMWPSYTTCIFLSWPCLVHKGCKSKIAEGLALYKSNQWDGEACTDSTCLQSVDRDLSAFCLQWSGVNTSSFHIGCKSYMMLYLWSRLIVYNAHKKKHVRRWELTVNTVGHSQALKKISKNKDTYIQCIHRGLQLGCNVPNKGQGVLCAYKSSLKKTGLAMCSLQGRNEVCLRAILKAAPHCIHSM